MIDLIFMLLGLLMYSLTDNKTSEVGRLMFFAGMLTFLFHGAHIPRLT